MLAVYNIKFNSDDYDILLRNRFTKLGFGIDYKDGLGIWYFTHNACGGITANPLYYSPTKLKSFALAVELTKNNFEERTRIIKADFDGDGSIDIITLKPKKNKTSKYTVDYDLEVKSRGKIFTITDVLVDESEFIKGLEKIVASPKINPFIGISYNCGAHSWGLTLYTFDGKSINKIAEFGSDVPSIQLKDVDNDREKEIVVFGRDWDSDNSVKNHIIYTYKYDGIEWKLISEQKTSTEKLPSVVKESDQINEGIVILKYNNTVNDLRVEVIWKPEILQNNYIIGSAIIKLTNVKYGGNSTLVSNNFGVLENRLSKFIQWQRKDGGKKIAKILNKTIYLDYKNPKIEEKQYKFGTTEEPFFFYDIDFDGKKELIVSEMFAGQRHRSIFRVYKLEEDSETSVLEYDYSQITYKEPYLFLDEASTVDRANKTIKINLSSGAALSETKSYKLR